MALTQHSTKVVNNTKVKTVKNINIAKLNYDGIKEISQIMNEYELISSI